ncbi:MULTISPECIES: phosphatase PAP2 family protein [unclassified Clostridium]|uniref:phosphatase PAP2 family protein n=1 Tax=unclassified Clostridium TaxID=2614128 RepID=UPI0002974802|nr:MULTISPECIES: phosphatase PAP2 family protein [unclassified Clostridium]EKQ52288.1 MAG: membrane-associated phospholipid phosphatase [Clostridium sp. Maddingley MBC34-26]
MLKGLENLDLGVLKFIHDISQNYIFDKIMPLITSLGNMGLIWIIIALILIFNKKYRDVGIMIIASLIVTSIIGEGILKNLIQRPRPFIDIPTAHLLISKPTSYSFPSGHTASSFTAVGIIFSTLRKFRIHAIILASLIAFSRMYLFVHYPSDILGGILLGIICSKIVLKVYKNRNVSIRDYNNNILGC